MQEEWRDVKGYEGRYKVSSLGRVYSHLTHRYLKNGHTVRGYCFVSLCLDGRPKNFLVHRLVATSFIPNPLNLPEVNHKDENRENNRVDNLEWCTPKYNCQYGTRNYRVGVKNGKRVAMYDLDDNYLATFVSSRVAARAMNTTHANILRVCNGKMAQTTGYKWRYADV